MEQQLVVAKQRFREAQDELEELRSLVEDQKAQASDYRTKVNIWQKFSNDTYLSIPTPSGMPFSRIL